MRFLRVDLRAFALVLAPILVGWLFLVLTDRTGPDEGIYAESPKLTLYKLPRPVEGRDLSFSDLTAATVVSPDPPIGGTPPGVRSFFIVGPHGAPATTFAGTAEIYVVTVDAGDPRATPRLTKIPSRVHRVNARTYQIVPDTDLAWTEQSPVYQQYFQALATTDARRSTLEVSAALVLSDSSRGTQRIYPVRLCPI